jgi:putative (di)nucleoside polyphosphate hydrolase
MAQRKYESLPYRPCAGVVLINRDGLVFGGQRIDNPGKAWQMPQGGLDFGELPEEAALRELTEETGVPRGKVEVLAQTRDWITYELPDELLGKLWKGKYRGQEQMWFAMRFLGDDSDIDIATETAEFSQWQWMTPEALIETIVPFKRHVYEAVFADLGEWVVPR